MHVSLCVILYYCRKILLNMVPWLQYLGGKHPYRVVSSAHLYYLVLWYWVWMTIHCTVGVIKYYALTLTSPPPHPQQKKKGWSPRECFFIHGDHYDPCLRRKWRNLSRTSFSSSSQCEKGQWGQHNFYNYFVFFIFYVLFFIFFLLVANCLLYFLGSSTCCS